MKERLYEERNVKEEQERELLMNEKREEDERKKMKWAVEN